MAAMDNEYVRQFDESLKTWTDHRFVSADQVRALSMFSLYLVNLSDDGGWVYVGHSFKRGVGLGSLVIRAVVDDTAVVTFITGRTFISCVTIFLRRLEDNVLEWRRDKYAG